MTALVTSFSENPRSLESCELSIVIPAFNEARRICRVLDDVLQFKASTERSLHFEVIVVDDGSSDETSEVVRFYATKIPIRIFKLPKNRGKGAAVRTGILNSHGSRVLFLDADGSTRLNELSELSHWLDQGCDVAFGSRAIQRTGVSVNTRLYRKLLGRFFHVFASWALPHGVLDSQCGFKLFTRDAALALFRRSYCNGFGFDVEILYLAGELGFKWKEVPINWTHTADSRLNLLSAPFSMFVEVFFICLRKVRKDKKFYFDEGVESKYELTVIND